MRYDIRNSNNGWEVLYLSVQVTALEVSNNNQFTNKTFILY